MGAARGEDGERVQEEGGDEEPPPSRWRPGPLDACHQIDGREEEEGVQRYLPVPPYGTGEDTQKEQQDANQQHVTDQPHKVWLTPEIRRGPRSGPRPEGTGDQGRRYDQERR